MYIGPSMDVLKRTTEQFENSDFETQRRRYVCECIRIYVCICIYIHLCL
jgi:hypothetical protein